MPLAFCPTRSLFHFATHAPQKETSTSGLVRIERTLPDNLHHAVVQYMQTGPNLMLAKGTPQELYTLLCPYMPPNTRKILDDAIILARLYQAHSKLSTVRFRLEHVRTDSCRKFHTDNVRLRLLCTYFGLATEWVPPEYLAPDNLNDYGVPKQIEDSSIHKLNVGDIALLKGRAWPGHSGVVHRSPPVSHLPAPQRSRLLLTIDEPTACGMSDEQTPTIRYTAEATA